MLEDSRVLVGGEEEGEVGVAKHHCTVRDERSHAKLVTQLLIKIRLLYVA